MEIKSPNHVYEVSYLVGETRTYRLYVAVQSDTDRECLLQVATDCKHNAGLERGAFILGKLKEESDATEKDFERVREHEWEMLNYHLGFPNVEESFVLGSEQGHRRVNILTFNNVGKLSDIVPLHNIGSKDSKRIDIKTAAWILGKTLKTLVLAHSVGISVGGIDITKVVLMTKEHYPILFDWSKATTHPEGVPMSQTRQEIIQVARAIITALGGNFQKREIPFEGNEDGYDLFCNHLFQLAGGSQPSAATAHKMFYELINQLWKPKFHPFTTYDLS